MPVPKRRHSKARKRRSRSNWKLAPPTLTSCPQCHAPSLPHHACPSCGTYQGRAVLKIKEKKGKKEKK